MRHILFLAVKEISPQVVCDSETLKFCKKRVNAGVVEMEFGSKYVYSYTDSGEESVSEEEFETGMDVTEQSWY